MFFFDQQRCLGCAACVTACLAWHAPQFGGMEKAPRRRRIVTAEYGDRPPQADRRYWSVACQHCQAPACMAACPKGAIFREDGLVVIDPAKCSGCGACARACPWGAVSLRERRPDKCTGCRERVAEGRKPACVAGCPLRALDFGTETELRERHPQAAAWPPMDGPFSPACGRTEPTTLICPRPPRYPE